MLRVITGPMYAGKTTALLDAGAGYASWLLVKPDLDDRYDEEDVVTHDGRAEEAVVVSSDLEEFDALKRRLVEQRPAAVGVDEAQFFDDALLDVVDVCAEQGIDVVVAGLEEDFAGRPFGPMPALVARADTVTRLAAECAVCGGRATRTQRLIDGEPAPCDALQVDVGGGRYEPRCAGCHEVGSLEG